MVLGSGWNGRHTDDKRSIRKGLGIFLLVCEICHSGAREQLQQSGFRFFWAFPALPLATANVCFVKLADCLEDGHHKECKA
jgi:hypothetical protein